MSKISIAKDTALNTAKKGSSSSKDNTSEENKSTYKFKTKDLSFNCRQLSAMLSSGLTLVKAIDILSKEQDDEKATKIWVDIYEQVQKGESFSAALEMQGDAFPTFMKSMVNAGESSGAMDTIMKRLEAHYDKENKMNNTIKGAMIYPVILLVLCVAVVIIIFTFIIPVLEPLFGDAKNLNIIAQFLLAGNKVFTKYWYLIIAVVIGLIFAIKYAFKIPEIGYKIDMYKITAPKIGPLMVKIYTARFARTLSSLYSSGIPMVECLKRSSDVLNNSYISEKFAQVIDEVKQGEALSAAITRTEIFESMFCSILFVGEEAGALDEILEKSADYYDEEADSAVQRLVSLLEPAMIIFLGVIVGLLLGGVYPAIYESLGGLENI